MGSINWQSLYLPVPALLFGTFVFLILRLRKWQSSSKSLRPPSPAGLPIIGHLHLLTDMPHLSLAHLAHKLGPIIYLRLGRVPTVVVSSADLAKHVLKTHDHIFASRPQLISAQYLSFGCSDVTFSPYGPYWRQARKICVTELLSAKRVSSFQLIRDEEVNRVLSSVSAQLGSEIDLGEQLFGLANDILCRVAFGKRFKEESGERQKRHLVDVLTETQALFAGFCLGDFFPDWEWINWVSGYKARLSRNLEDLRAVCEEIIKEHVDEKGKAGVVGKEDFVDVLLRVQQREDLEVPITDDNLKALVLVFIFKSQSAQIVTLSSAEIVDMIEMQRVYYHSFCFSINLFETHPLKSDKREYIMGQENKFCLFLFLLFNASIVVFRTLA
jgi:cytochrome P450